MAIGESMEKFIGGLQGFFIGLAIGAAGGAIAFYFLVAKVKKIREFIFGK